MRSCPAADFQSFYNILKNSRGHSGARSAFSDRTEESSAVQYFQVRTAIKPFSKVYIVFQRVDDLAARGRVRRPVKLKIFQTQGFSVKCCGVQQVTFKHATKVKV